MNGERSKEYWRKNISLIRNLMIIWALVSLVAAIILAKPLTGINFGKVPMSFWFAQQGSIIIFVIQIFYYSWKMDQLDQEYDVHEVKLTDVKISQDKGVVS